MEKIVLATALFIFAIQFATASSTEANDLESLIKNAVEEISKTHNQFSKLYEEIIDYSRNAWIWINRNETMMDRVKDSVYDSVDKINRFARKLTQDGRENDEPEEYFKCVEERRKNAVESLEEEDRKFAEFLKLFREQAERDVSESLIVMEKLFLVTKDLKREFLRDLSDCESKECIVQVLEEAKRTYESANSVLNVHWNRTARAFLKFKSVTNSKSKESVEIVSKQLKNAVDDMLRC